MKKFVNLLLKSFLFLIILSDILYPGTLFSDIFEQHHATNGIFLNKIKTKKKSIILIFNSAKKFS